MQNFHKFQLKFPKLLLLKVHKQDSSFMHQLGLASLLWGICEDGFVHNLPGHFVFNSSSRTVCSPRQVTENGAAEIEAIISAARLACIPDEQVQISALDSVPSDNDFLAAIFRGIAGEEIGGHGDNVVCPALTQSLSLRNIARLAEGETGVNTGERVDTVDWTAGSTTVYIVVESSIMRLSSYRREKNIGALEIGGCLSSQRGRGGAGDLKSTEKK
jgi:hypothetical protein